MRKQIFIALILLSATLATPIFERYSFSWSYTFSEWIYQENPTQAVCTGDWMTTYPMWQPCENAFDGNWSTNAMARWENASVYINYIKPRNATIMSKWQVKDGTSEAQTINLTIPVSCWVQPTLQFRMTSTEELAMDYLDCWNGQSWINLRTIQSGGELWEEGMWWYYVALQRR